MHHHGCHFLRKVDSQQSIFQMFLIQISKHLLYSLYKKLTLFNIIKHRYFNVYCTNYMNIHPSMRTVAARGHIKVINNIL